MLYTVLNTRTEETSTHRSWGGAMRAASKHPAREVLVYERDRDGERVYNQAGQKMDASGHFPKPRHEEEE